MVELPKDRDNRIEALVQMANRAVEAARVQQVRWMIANYWMQGYRNLEVQFSTGEVRTTLHNQVGKDNRLKLVYEPLVPRLQTERGRLGRMDVRPAVKSVSYGLYNVRKAATGRVLLDYLTRHTDWDHLKRQFNNHFTLFGTAGIAAWINQGVGLGAAVEEGEETADTNLILEVIPPWELTPVPSNPDSPDQVEGIRRARWVPLNWVKAKLDFSMPRDREKLQVRQGPYGEPPGRDAVKDGGQIQDSPMLFSAAPDETQGEAKEQAEYVLLEEFFFLAERKDRLSRWIVKIGKHECKDVNFEENGQVVYCPIGVARYHQLGGFYGRSFIDPMISLNSEAEQLLQSFIQNIKDLDTFGVLMVPNNWNVPKQELLKSGKTRKVVYYEPDLSAPEAKLEHVQPVMANEIPGKALVQIQRLIDDQAQHSDLLKGDAPGRVDSMGGLEFLHETSSIPLSEPASSVADAFRQVYKAILGAAPDLVEGRQDLPLLGLDDNLLGLKMDPTGQTVKLEAKNIPTPADVEIGVRDEMPVNPSIRKRELQEALKMQIITPQEFKIICWREQIEYPTGSWTEKEAYRKAMLQCLYTFGDGEEPGQNILVSSQADLFDIHLLVIGMFMAKPEFSFVSLKVRQAFEALKQTYQNLKGAGYPAQMPYPEEAAMMAQQMGGGMGGGMPPGIAA